MYQIEDGLTELRNMGDSIRPYLAYLMRAGLYGGSIRIVFSSFRDAWSARLLYELLETSSNERTAQNAWNILKTMGKLPKEWRKPKFTTSLWEECRTKPAELPAQTETDWIPIIKWNLLFKLMDDDQTLKDDAMDGFEYLGTKSTLGLLSAIEEGDPDLTKTALIILKRVGDSRAVAPLQTLENHDDSIIRMLAKSTSKAVAQREYQQAVPKHQPPSQETLDQREAWSREMASPTISGQFDAELERRIARALLRTATPDPDEKQAGWKEFDRLGESALPILRHFAQSGTDAQKRQAQQVLKVNFAD